MPLEIRTQPPATLSARLEPAEQAVQRLLSRAEIPDACVSLLFVDDAAIQALNRTWRQKDAPTDVLSWPLFEPHEPKPDGAELGDVAISLETAARQAARRGWPLDDEIALLLVHGVLHLLGYDDATEEESAVMQAIEAELLGKPLDPV
jgi:probable rRNA maturation factor